jgi:integrase/recombinase XerD
LIVSVYVRHAPDCPHRKHRHYRRCRCPKWLYFTYRGKKSRQSARTRSWEQAEKNARALEREYEARERAASEGRQPRSNEPKVMTVKDAVDRYLADKHQQNCAEETLTKLATLFQKQLAEWSNKKGLLYLVEITLDHLEEFRKSWKDKSPLSRKKKQERIIGFFWFALRHGWIKENPAAGLSRILGDDQPVTLYFARDEFDKIIDATYIYNPSGYTEPRNQATRLRVLTLLMRWSGLSIRDAITLERSRLNDRDELFLYRAKTGVPVFVKLPPDVASELRKVPPGPSPNPMYFFWTGNGAKKSAVADWQRSYRRLFKLVDLKNADGKKKRCYPHMFRDTFAVELLLAGVPLDQVSILLGHRSIKTTEKHYSPFVKARQEQLVAAVQKAWITPTKKKTQERRVTKKRQVAAAAST